MATPDPVGTIESVVVLALARLADGGKFVPRNARANSPPTLIAADQYDEKASRERGLIHVAVLPLSHYRALLRLADAASLFRAELQKQLPLLSTIAKEPDATQTNAAGQDQDRADPVA